MSTSAISSDSSVVAKSIMGKLFDKKLVNRYGTGLKTQMSDEDSISKRYELLKEEFSRINKDGNDYIDVEEFFQFSQNYRELPGGKAVSRNYIEKMFAYMDTDKDNKISIQEFVASYLYIEEKLKLKKIQLVHLSNEVKDSIKKLTSERNQHSNEKLNSNGIRDDAEVSITLMEARDLRPMDFNGKSDPYCVMTAGGYGKVKSTYKPNTLNPVWNEDFKM